MKKLQSMTGFGTATKANARLSATCEMRSVNGKSLDLRLRVPPSFEELEPAIKKRIAQFVERGNIQVSVTIEELSANPAIQIDELTFSALAKQAVRLAKQYGVAPPTADGILGARGVILSQDNRAVGFIDDAEKKRAQDLLMATVEAATVELVDMREREGDALHKVLSDQLNMIDRLVISAREDEASRPAAMMARLVAQVDALLAATGASADKLDQDRLHAEVALLATKTDIREETDRLSAHIIAARELLNQGGAVGRKLDFLSQEFNRETNTICSKSVSTTLTATGLALKAVIDQFREQVQNLA
ncbi:MAG: YicC/YloC family endoribonuclease [Ahrensia sp.]|nr:YicC/YloC family endoribonuclease [Ahrensia sp.]